MGQPPLTEGSRSFASITTEGFADLGDTTHGHLRRQPKFVPQVPIIELLKFDLVSCLKLEGFARQPIGGGVKRLHGVGELAGLIPIGQGLCLQGQYHDMNYNTSDTLCPLTSDIRE
jgi:hypothetical protein